MFKRLTIDIPETAFTRLVQRAERERRDPRDEAALLVERALQRGGRLRPGDQVEQLRPLAGASA